MEPRILSDGSGRVRIFPSDFQGQMTSKGEGFRSQKGVVNFP